MTRTNSAVSFDRERITRLLETLETLVAGDTGTSLEISPLHDELDAVAFGINALADELRWAHARMIESERLRAEELRDQAARLSTANFAAEVQAAVLRDQLAHLGRVTVLNALTGSIAHEISQPLTAVMANAEAALRLLAAQPPRLVELGETLHDMLSDNARAGEVVLRLKALLKKGPSRHEPLDVNGIASDVVKLVHSHAVGRQTVLDVDFAPDLEPVLGDRIQIQQVVLNLLLNAFDAVQECDVADRRVHLLTSSRDRTATVVVSDRGCGLSDEALAHAFDPFYTTKPDGLGLGLSICRTIVAAHHGTLEAARNSGPGTTFSVRLPVWRSDEPGEPS